MGSQSCPRLPPLAQQEGGQGQLKLARNMSQFLPAGLHRVPSGPQLWPEDGVGLPDTVREVKQPPAHITTKNKK